MDESGNDARVHVPCLESWVGLKDRDRVGIIKLKRKNPSKYRTVHSLQPLSHQ